MLIKQWISTTLSSVITTISSLLEKFNQFWRKIVLNFINIGDILLYNFTVSYDCRLDVLILVVSHPFVVLYRWHGYVSIGVLFWWHYNLLLILFNLEADWNILSVNWMWGRLRLQTEHGSNNDLHLYDNTNWLRIWSSLNNLSWRYSWHVLH